MAQSGFTPIQLYFSTTAASAPSAGNLANGELAVNITDGKLFYKDNGGVVRVLATAAGASGDVVGPASATDNALARFDTTTGKLVQNSVGVLSDAGVLTGLTGLTSSGNVTLSALTSGRVTYATTAGLLTDSVNLTFDGSNLGLGVTPSAWGVGKAIDVGSTTAVFNDGSGATYIGNNFYFNSGFKYKTNNVASYYLQGSTHAWYTAPSGTAGAAITFTQAMTLDASGNLGIGTTSPTNSRLEVTDNSTYFQWLGRSVGVDRSINLRAATGYNASLLFTQNGVADRWAIGTKSGDGSLYFATGDSLANGATRATLDSAGNLGLGVTPSAWGSTYKAIDLGNASLFTDKTSSASFALTSNSYFDGTSYRYVSTNSAARHDQSNGSHQWHTAPSGTAGAAITFTQAMTLDASGNLGIGTTSPNASSILDAQSTTKGVRMPNMTTTQKNAIASPAAGLMVFDTTLAKLCVYTGAAWQTITSA